MQNAKEEFPGGFSFFILHCIPLPGAAYTRLQRFKEQEVAFAREGKPQPRRGMPQS